MSTDESPLCTFCEMIVFWVQMELKQQKTKDLVIKYVNEVTILNNKTVYNNFLLFLHTKVNVHLA